MKKTIYTIILFFCIFQSFGQWTFGAKISNEEIKKAIINKNTKVKTKKLIDNNSKSFYIENYNKNGFITSHKSTELDETIYIYNKHNKRTLAYELINNKQDTIWEAYYTNDTILSKEIWYNMYNYIKEIYYDKKERKINIKKIYKNSNKIDTTIIKYKDFNTYEYNYENGKLISYIFTKSLKQKEISTYYNIENNDTLKYLTWTTIYDKKRREIKKTNNKIKYLTKYRRKGKKQISIVKENNKLKFKTIDFFYNENLIKSIYIEKNYKTISENYYLNKLIIKSTKQTFKNNVLLEINEFYYTYTYYE